MKKLKKRRQKNKMGHIKTKFIICSIIFFVLFALGLISKAGLEASFWVSFVIATGIFIVSTTTKWVEREEKQNRHQSNESEERDLDAEEDEEDRDNIFDNDNALVDVVFGSKGSRSSRERRKRYSIESDYAKRTFKTFKRK